MNAITKLTVSRVKSFPPNVLVLGGYGFIGRHIVTELEDLNVPVLIGTRRKRKSSSKRNERHILLHKLSNDPTWKEQLNGVDVVINSVGILRQRWGETYEKIHHQAVAEIANACAERGIRFIHVSALGLNNEVKSRFLSSKLLGELALVTSRADWHLVRPSIVDGQGGYGAKWFRRVAKWPVHFIPSNSIGRMAPISATDLGKAIANIALKSNSLKIGEHNTQRIYELGGAKTMGLQQYLTALRLKKNITTPKPVRCASIPASLARLVSHVCDLLHLTPFSFGHYELLKSDNLPKDNCLTQMLAEWQCHNKVKLAHL